MVTLRNLPNPARRHWIALVLVLALAAPAVRAQTAGSRGADPFGQMNAELARAVNSQLLRAGEISPGSSGDRALMRQSLAAATESDLPGNTFSGVSTQQILAARQRLFALGVDAARIFTEEGVPPELLRVAAVESNYDPLALSPRGARGIWQLMPETAARLGLRVDSQTDERTHPERSTRAAAQYLRKLYLQFGDWWLALAAYNAGEAAVATAIRRAGTTDFWQLAGRGILPEETRRYVPAVLTPRTSR
jgi:hypothetical protein